MGNNVFSLSFCVCEKIIDIYHWYFTEDYSLLKFYDITVILIEDYNLAVIS